MDGSLQRRGRRVLHIPLAALGSVVAALCLSQLGADCNPPPRPPVALSGPTSLSTQPGTYTIDYQAPTGADGQAAGLVFVWLVEEAQGTNTGGGVFSWVIDTFSPGPNQHERTVSLHLFCSGGHVMGADSPAGTGQITDCRSPHVHCTPSVQPNGPCSCETPNYQPNNPDSGLQSAHVHAEIFTRPDGSDRVASNTLIVNCN